MEIHEPGAFRHNSEELSVSTQIIAEVCVLECHVCLLL